MKQKKQIIEDLRSKNNLVVLNAISVLRKQGNPEDINEITELLHTTLNEEVKKSIGLFLCDLKNQKTVPYIIKILQNVKYKKDLDVIVSSCWQSGLDYNNYLSLFVDLAISENYIVAFEAFTVIENMTGSFTLEEIEISIKKIKTAIDLQDKEKNYLYVELIKVLESWKL